MFDRVFEDDAEENMNSGFPTRYAIPVSTLISKSAPLGIFPMINRDVTASDTISWRCSEGHEFSASWRKQRNSRCPQCPALSYGEKLARSLFDLYFPDGEWRKVRDIGFDPTNPGLRLEIDLVSDEHQITVECQSSLHDPNVSKQGLATKIPIDEMLRRDALKRNLHSTHDRFADFKHVELWLELAEVSKIVANAVSEGGDPVEVIVNRFANSLSDAGVALPVRPIPRLDELFSGFSEARRTAGILRERGLLLRPDVWLGVSALPVTCRTCMHEWTSSLSQLRRGWSRGRSGCAKCWGTAFDQLSASRSEAGWASFRELCLDNGYTLLRPTSGPGNVDVSIRAEATGQTISGSRHYLAKRILDGLPIIDAKKVEYERRRAQVACTLDKYRMFLKTYGILLLPGQNRPTTYRDPLGNIRTNKFEVRYLGCGHRSKVHIGPFMQKLRKNKSRAPDGVSSLCPSCLREKISCEKTNLLIQRAAEYGVSFLGPRYIDATKTRYRFSCLPGCEEGPYKALISNIEKNGIACRGCNRIRKKGAITPTMHARDA